MATTAFIYLFFSSLGSLPRPRWVVGHLLLVRGQQAAICWPAGPQRIGKAGGGGGTIQQPVARTAAVVYILEGLPLYRVRCELGSV